MSPLCLFGKHTQDLVFSCFNGSCKSWVQFIPMTVLSSHLSHLPLSLNPLYLVANTKCSCSEETWFGGTTGETTGTTAPWHVFAKQWWCLWFPQLYPRHRYYRWITGTTAGAGSFPRQRVSYGPLVLQVAVPPVFPPVVPLRWIWVVFLRPCGEGSHSILFFPIGL